MMRRDLIKNLKMPVFVSKNMVGTMILTNVEMTLNISQDIKAKEDTADLDHTQGLLTMIDIDLSGYRKKMADYHYSILMQPSWDPQYILCDLCKSTLPVTSPPPPSYHELGPDKKGGLYDTKART